MCRKLGMRGHAGCYNAMIYAQCVALQARTFGTGKIALEPSQEQTLTYSMFFCSSFYSYIDVGKSVVEPESIMMCTVNV